MFAKLITIWVISFSIFILTLLLDHQEAISAYNNNPKMPSDLIETLEDMEARFEEADKLYEKARRFAERKEYEKAIEYFEKSLKKNPRNIAVNNGLSWLLLSCDDLKYRDLKRALLHAKKATTGDEFACGSCWDTLALAYYKVGETEKAHFSYLKAMTLLGKSSKEAIADRKLLF